MMKKLSFALIAILLLVGAYDVWHTYKNYEQRRQEHIVQLEQQAKETQVTFIEGWTLNDDAGALAKQSVVSSEDFKAAAKNIDLKNYPLISQAKPAQSLLEGFLFPDTYRFAKNTTATVVIDKMLANFTTRVNTLGVHEGQGLYSVPNYESQKLSFYQILTLASIIEKESGGKNPDLSLDQQRALIAGVMYNRLAKGMALESDATVNYATGKSLPGASAEDIKINSPYNTYKYPGLPPGPICNPSLSSINAALHPQNSDYFYFFHRQPSGEVVFSKTFAEHKQQMGR